MKPNLKKIKERGIEKLLEFGILNIDKPSGPTSFKTAEIVSEKLKEVGFEIRKFSHFGTLDPKVTGVLPIALNRACKLTRWFMEKDKTYVGVMKIHKKIGEERLRKEMEKFIGKIKQKPPVKSNVKRQIREREVYSWDLLEYNENGEGLFKTEVEKGTYIRKLIHNLGRKIGGGHMLELRRTEAGIFSEKDKNFVNLYDLEKAIKEYKNGQEKELRKIITPGEAIGKILPTIQINDNKKRIKQLLTGKPLMKQDLRVKLDIKEGDMTVFSKNKFIGVYKKVREGNIVGRPEFVFN